MPQCWNNYNNAGSNSGSNNNNSGNTDNPSGGNEDDPGQNEDPNQGNDNPGSDSDISEEGTLNDGNSWGLRGRGTEVGLPTLFNKKGRNCKG